MLAFLRRLLGFGPAHTPECVEFFNEVAHALGYRITWDEVDADTCTFDVMIGPTHYWLWITMPAGFVKLTMFCKSKPDVLPTGMRAKLARRNRKLRYGEWLVMKERIAFHAQIPDALCNLSNLRDAIRIVISEVSMLDRKCSGPAQEEKPEVVANTSETERPHSS